jgi:hypothetical protein
MRGFRNQLLILSALFDTSDHGLEICSDSSRHVLYTSIPGIRIKMPQASQRKIIEIKKKEA